MPLGTQRRKKQEGLTNAADVVRIGEQVERNTQSDKLAQSGTLKFGQGRSTLRRETGVVDHRQTFRDSAKSRELDDPRQSTADIIKGREVRKGPAKATEITGQPVRGTLRPVDAAKAQGDIEQGSLDKMKPGSSIGNFSIGRRTAADDNARLTGGAKGIFGGKGGLKQLFSSTADLAKVFASPEYQAAKAAPGKSAIAQKTKIADQKALNEKVKTLGTLQTQLVEGGEDPDSPLMQKIKAQLQESITGGTQRDASQKIDILGRLLELGNLSPEQEQLFTGA